MGWMNRPGGRIRAACGLLLLPALQLSCGWGDFGQNRQAFLELQSRAYFGFGTPLAESADAGDVVPRQLAGAGQRQFLAEGLAARFVARNLARAADMIAFWPNDVDYTHLVLCIEQARSNSEEGAGRNPSVQRVDLSSGEVRTILFGMDHCDGIRTTPWGTILASEETDSGSAYEILDPLATSGHWIADRGAAGMPADVRIGIDEVPASPAVVKRTDLPVMAWEGLTVLRNGVVYAGDEERPGGSGVDSDGGTIYKFVPGIPYDCLEPIAGSPLGEGGVCSNPISDLDDSPLRSGRVYAIQVSCLERNHGTFPRPGQGCEVGEAAWVLVRAAQARSEAHRLHATGYYRPEDLHRLRTEEESEVRFCWTDTGRSNASHFGELMCATDENPLGEGTIEKNQVTYLGDGAQPGGLAVVTVTRFLQGDQRFNSFDNLDIQPLTGNFYIAEDAPFGEVYACLPDGGDRDLESDGCVSVLSIRDPGAEPSGFIFDGTGEVAFYVLQHGQQPEVLRDFNSNPLDGGTDDLIMISGFRTREVGNRPHSLPSLPPPLDALAAAFSGKP